MGAKSALSPAALTNQKSFIFDYPSYGKFIIKLEVKDAYGNVESMRQIVDVQAPTGDANATTINTLPQLKTNNQGSTVAIGKALDNTLSVYISHT